MTPRDAIPQSWTDHVGRGTIAIGHDIATTTKEGSNWSAVTVTQHSSPLYVERLDIRWRTENPEVNLGILDVIVSDLEALGLRPRRLCVDATNEKYHAQRTRSYFAGRVPVELVVASEKVEWRGESYIYATLLGNLYVAAYEDNVIATPGGQENKWLFTDRRLVKKVKGKFEADTGKDGGHADTFSSGELALWGLTRKSSGSAGSVEAVSIGSELGKAPARPSSRNPFRRLFQSSGGVKA
jgi:hypothetical protein